MLTRTGVIRTSLALIPSYVLERRTLADDVESPVSVKHELGARAGALYDDVADGGIGA